MYIQSTLNQAFYIAVVSLTVFIEVRLLSAVYTKSEISIDTFPTGDGGLWKVF